MLGVLGLLLAGATPPPPAVTTVIHDAGTVDRGTVVSHDFRFRNRGEEPVTLRVAPAAAIPAWDLTVAPGEARPVTLRLDTSRLRGAVQKSARVTVPAGARVTLDPDPGAK